MTPSVHHFLSGFAAIAAMAPGVRGQEVVVGERPLNLTVAADSVSAIQTKVADLEARIVSIGQALAASNAEAASLREDYQRLSMQTEALGLSALGADVRLLQQRLVSAVSDFRLSEKENQSLREHVVSLSEAALAVASDPSSEAARARLREEIASANQGLATSSQTAAPVAADAARVVSLKSDLGLAVINAGRDSGLRVGAPMKIMRGDQTLASGLIVDVRSRISGLLITSPDFRGQVKAGDSVRSETSQSSQQ